MLLTVNARTLVDRKSRVIPPKLSKALLQGREVMTTMISGSSAAIKLFDWLLHTSLGYSSFHIQIMEQTASHSMQILLSHFALIKKPNSYIGKFTTLLIQQNSAWGRSEKQMSKSQH